jgi:subtilisin family serine protease
LLAPRAQNISSLSSMAMKSMVLCSLLMAGCTSVDTRPPKEQMARQVVFTISAEPGQEATDFSKVGLDQMTDPKGVKIQLAIQDILRLHNLRKIAEWPIKSLGLQAVVAEIGKKTKLTDLISALSRDKRVETVESVKTYKLHTYNDPYFDLQNTVNNDDIEHIHKLATGKGVVVGVVDTGVDRDHPELRDRIIYSHNFVSHDQIRFDQDEHGTTVAGIIGSTANNDLGIVGVAPDVKLMAFKACWHDTLTQAASCDSVSLMKALMAVLKQQPDILNLSLSGPSDPLIESLLKAASDQGIVLVSARDEKRRNSFPASMTEVIGVGTPLGISQSASIPVSASGLNGMTDDPYGVLAPGTDILTTTPGATYAFRTGSSLASAYVSGIAALMKERQPALSGRQIELHLRNTSRVIINTIPVVDMCAALRRNDELCPGNSMTQVTDE